MRILLLFCFILFTYVAVSFVLDPEQLASQQKSSESKAEEVAQQQVPEPAKQEPDQTLHPAIFPVNDELLLDNILATQQVVLIFFHTDSCGHCEQVVPNFAEAAEKLSRIEYVFFCSVNVDKNPKMAAKYGITVSPTIKAFIHWAEKPLFVEPTNKAHGFIEFVKLHLTSYCKYVVSLNNLNVRAFINSATRVFVVYCPMDQPHCRRLVPQLNEVAKEMHGEDAGIVVIDDPKWGAQFYIHNDEKELDPATAPHISFVEFGRPKYSHTDGSDALSLTSRIVHELSTTEQVLFSIETVEELNKEIEEKSVIVVGFFENFQDDNAIFFKLFEIFAFQNRRLCSFALVQNRTELLAFSKATALPAIVMYKSFDDKRIELQESLNTYEFNYWVRHNFIPIMSAFDPSLYRAYVWRRMPVLYFLFDVQDKSHEVTLIRFNFFAKKYHHEATFITVDINDFQVLTQYMNLTKEQLPAMILEDVPDPRVIELTEGEAMLGRLHILRSDSETNDLITIDMESTLQAFQNGLLNYTVPRRYVFTYATGKYIFKENPDDAGASKPAVGGK